MGSGIAQVAATYGWQVKLFDLNKEALDTSRSKLEKILIRLIEKGRMDEAKKQDIQAHIDYVDSMEAFADCDLVIEAIIEDLAIKKKVFMAVEAIVSDSCIIASNTSSLSIASLASACRIPERFIGIHFFNPVPLMKLVEIIPAVQTSDETRDQAKAIIDSWEKLTVIAKDTPGFIVNKVARPFYSEALRIAEEGIADYATIDWAMKEIGGFRMGPFELMDFIGNDVNYAVTESVFAAYYYDPRYKPAFAQKRLSEAGYLGRKSGRGYYDYSEGAEKASPNTDSALGERIVNRIVALLIDEAADAVMYGVASVEDVETAMTKGVNYPKGLLAWADEIGIQNCVNRLDVLFDYYRDTRYRCCGLLREMARNNSTFSQSG